MASPRNRRHIIVPGNPTVERYTPHRRKIEAKKLPAPASRPAHGAALKQSLENATDEAAVRRENATDAGITVHGAVPGLVLIALSMHNLSIGYVQLSATPRTSPSNGSTIPTRSFPRCTRPAGGHRPLSLAFNTQVRDRVRL